MDHLGFGRKASKKDARFLNNNNIRRCKSYLPDSLFTKRKRRQEIEAEAEEEEEAKVDEEYGETEDDGESISYVRPPRDTPWQIILDAQLTWRYKASFDPIKTKLHRCPKEQWLCWGPIKSVNDEKTMKGIAMTTRASYRTSLPSPASILGNEPYKFNNAKFITKFATLIRAKVKEQYDKLPHFSTSAMVN